MTPDRNEPNDLTLLKWYAEVGVDAAVGDEPRDRYESAPPPEAETEAERDRPAPAETAARPAAPPAASSKEVAAQCNSLADLREAVETFTGCDLRRTAKTTVFADGNPDADVMFVGEAPGRDEDIQGLPFVGPAGKLLDKMLKAIGRDRKSAYISNILNWRPPGNRTPTDSEALICLPFIRRHIALAKPQVVVLLGGTAAKHLLDTKAGIMRLRGKWTEIMLDEYGEHTLPALPTLHPAYLLRQPAHKSLAWRDFLSLDERLSGEGESD